MIFNPLAETERKGEKLQKALQLNENTKVTTKTGTYTENPTSAASPKNQFKFPPNKFTTPSQ